MSKKRCLVTGGAGFLGSHLCERLLKEENEVFCLDNFSTGSEKNIAHLLKDPNFSVLEHDVCHTLYVEVDEIYNLASLASPFHYQRDPIKTLKTNVLGALNMLELAKRSHAKILQASTSEVYGDPTLHPQKEEYWGNVNPIGPRACYDEGKRAAEALFFDFYRKHKVPIKVLRIFNTYGPNMRLDDGRVISNLVCQALRKEPLTLYGDGKQTRSFCYVEDMIEAFVVMMKSDSWITGPINVGNPEEYSIEQVAKLIQGLTQSPSSLCFKGISADDPKKRKPDIGLAKKLLGWEPKIPFELGLKKTLAYFEKILQEEASEPAEEDAFLSL